jgi:hypothetical protein
MAISGLQIINVGLPNESTGSDSLYDAFNKVKNNFNTLFACSSPYNSYTGNTGITVSSNSTTGVVDITNSGVTYLQAGTGIVLTGNTGNITISSTGGNGNGSGGTVTSVGVLTASATRITVGGSPIVSNGNIVLDLATTGVTSGVYTYPTVTVDSYGRIVSIANAAAVGTVTGVTVTPGFGIQVSSSGNSNLDPFFTVTNTGVTRLSAGAGISLSGSNGNITVSTSGVTAGTVTSIGVTSTSLTITGSPITSSGTITVDLPNNISIASTPVAYNGNGTILTGRLLGKYANRSGGANFYYFDYNSSNTINSADALIALRLGSLLDSTAGNANLSMALGTTYGNKAAGLGFVSGTSLDVTAASAGTTPNYTGNINAVLVGYPTVGPRILVQDYALADDSPNVISHIATTHRFYGNILANSTGGIGYTTGSGGTITQGTSRTTGVTLDKPTGAITLVSAAGSASYQTFTVTNSTVAATDVIIVNQKSGTDKYLISVTAVSAGSFAITFATTGGTTTEQPVFNFAVIKGIAA